MRPFPATSLKQWGFVVLICFCVFTAFANYNYHRRVLDRLDLAKSQQKETQMNTITHTWISGGVEVSVTTSTEIDNWEEVHAQKVKNAMERWPKD